MQIFRVWVFVLSVVALASSGLQAMEYQKFFEPKALLSMPKPIQDYSRMLTQIVKEQKNIGNLVSEGKYDLAREVAGVGLKVGQANYWLRQNIKENLKSLRAVHPNQEKLLSGFFGLLDNFYDAEAKILGSAQFIAPSDLDRFNNALMRLGWDKTHDKLKAMLKLEPLSIIPKPLVSKVFDARNEALSTGKMIYDRFSELLKAKEKEQGK